MKEKIAVGINGFSIPFCLISQKIKEKIIKDLKIYIPSFQNLGEATEFNLFHLDKEKSRCYIPLHYAKSLGIEPEDILWKNPESVETIKDSNISLRDEHQVNCHNLIMNVLNEKKYGGGIINLSTGSGKCFGIENYFYAYDPKSRGRIKKKVYEIEVGDLLLRPNKQYSEVVGTAYGTDYMFYVLYKDGSGYFKVNTGHELILYDTVKKVVCKKKIEEIKDTSIYKCLKLNNDFTEINMVDFMIHPAGIGLYYGFELEKNKRICIKDDGSIVHNTVVSLKSISDCKYKTLIVVNKLDTMRYWMSEIERFIPDSRVGSIQGKTFDVEGKDIVVGMIHTLTMKDFEESQKSLLKHFDLMIIDEIHCIPTEKFSNLFNVIFTRYIFGLTATLERQDKLEVVLKYFVGDVLYSNISNSKKQTTDIYIYKNFNNIKEYKINKDVLNIPKTINWLVKDKERNNKIIEIIKELLNNEKRQVLVVSDRKTHLNEIKETLNDERVGLFVGGMKEEDLKRTKEESKIILSTSKMVSDGFNCKRLNTLFITTPKSNIIQLIGRIYRKKHEDIRPCIIDISDEKSYALKAQFNKRVRQFSDEIETPSFHIIS